MKTAERDFISLSPLRFKPSKGQVHADLGGEVAILDSNSGIYYGLDPVGARIWFLMQEEKDFTEIRSILLEEYEVDPTILEADMVALVAELESKGLIEVSHAPVDSGA